MFKNFVSRRQANRFVRRHSFLLDFLGDFQLFHILVLRKLFARFVYLGSLDLIRSNSCLLGRPDSPQLHFLSFEFVPKDEISLPRLHDLHWGQQTFSCPFVNFSNVWLQSLHSNSKIGMGYSFYIQTDCFFWPWAYPTAEHFLSESSSKTIIGHAGVTNVHSCLWLAMLNQPCRLF